MANQPSLDQLATLARDAQKAAFWIGPPWVTAAQHRIWDDYIAALSPTAVLELIARVKAAEQVAS